MEPILFYGNTDLGQIRTNNEDAFIAQNIWDKDHVLAVAIDGVGGYEGGEIAAAIAKKSIINYLESYPNGECLDLLKQAVIFANNTIFQERKEQPEYGNMSCVLTAILVEIKNMRINLAHVGDTRLYQYSNKELVKLSHDHSLVGYREEIGELSELEAMKHPQRNVIGRDVGSTYLEASGNDYVEINTFPLIPNSTLLLCSDGLCDMITSAQMESVLKEKKSVKDKVNLLIKAANDAGGKDNVTVVLLQVKVKNKVTQDITPAPITTNNEDKNSENNDNKTNNEKIIGYKKKRVWLYLLIILVLITIGFIFCGIIKNKPVTNRSDNTDITAIGDSTVIDSIYVFTRIIEDTIITVNNSTIH